MNKDIIEAVSRGETDSKTISSVVRLLALKAKSADALLDAVPLPVFYKDRNGLYTGCNKAFESFFSIKRQELCSQDLFLYPSETEAEHCLRDAELFANPSLNISYRGYGLKHGSAEKHILVFHKSAICGDDGSPLGLVCVIQDLTGEIKQHRDLEQSRAEFNAIVEKNGDAILILDTAGKILYMNPCGQKIFPHFSVADESAFPYPCVAGMNSEIFIFPSTYELRVLETVWKSSPALLVMVRDISRLKKAESVLDEYKNNLEAINVKLTEALIHEKDLKQEAASAAEAKNIFLSGMSHELRTPMNGVIGIANALLSRNDLPSAVRSEIEVILRSGSAVMSSINEIIEYSRMDTSRTPLSTTEFNLQELVEEISGILAVRASASGVNFYLHYSPDAPRFIRADQDKFRHLLMSIGGNAVKFTENGHVRIDVSSRTLDENSVLIDLDISDTGIGIPESALDRIFESFTQLDSAKNRKYDGLGLGLSIARQIVSIMNGNIVVQSSHGKGSAFHISIPVALSRLVHEGIFLRDKSSVSLLLYAEDCILSGILSSYLFNAGISFTLIHSETELKEIASERNKIEPFNIFCFALGLQPSQKKDSTPDALRLVRKLCPAAPGLLVAPQTRLSTFPESSDFAAYVASPLRESQLFYQIAKLLRG